MFVIYKWIDKKQSNNILLLNWKCKHFKNILGKGPPPDSNYIYRGFKMPLQGTHARGTRWSANHFGKSNLAVETWTVNPFIPSVTCNYSIYDCSLYDVLYLYSISYTISNKYLDGEVKQMFYRHVKLSFKRTVQPLMQA